MTEFCYSLSVRMALDSIIRRAASKETNNFQPEEEFVPFHLPPAKPQPTVEAQPPVAVPTSSEAIPVPV